ncbi:unnamed protein product [Colias eurytheme]|nr:unnamed protein product [Colias eurytheme]
MLEDDQKKREKRTAERDYLRRQLLEHASNQSKSETSGQYNGQRYAYQQQVPQPYAPSQIPSPAITISTVTITLTTASTAITIT